MTHRPNAEISWFSALCDDDYQFLGVEDPALKASWPHCRDIAMAAEANGFDNILLPSGYALGMDSIAFAGGIAPLLEKMRLLVAVRCGEMWVPQLARQLATLDRMLNGRLTINIISSDMPGQSMESGPRYQRTLETMQALRALLNGVALSMAGEFVQLDIDPPRMAPHNGQCPPFYFGGLSPQARDTAAQAADVFLMWPDTEDAVQTILDDMRTRASGYDRELKFGYRAHVIVRETEAQARAAADQLVSKLDAATGEEIRNRSLDSQSIGVRRQAELRDTASALGDGDFVEPNLWTGVGRARSGCGAAIVGDPDQVLAKINRYRDMGIEAFILSGYPHKDECDLFARYVLPQINHAPLALDD
ncbi:MAG: alkanesulfonate monooxygenase [Rhizobiales bacterium TMED143]|nr:alkanesulfonate monooxygenase [Rhodobiaceae bacterium]OUV93497.1 MAG: alkanesulfonate monooxygenase [Rhizobiales bacterium TMED143]CAI8396637.1 MAG: Methanesulfonate monooxygenase [Rhodobiaceae bacterium UBA7378]